MKLDHIQFILSHFEEPVFPRKIMTSISNGQFSVNSQEEVLQKCERANFTDCRINAYPQYTDYKGIVRFPPTFVFIDLDLANFNYDRKKIDKALKATLKKINEYGAYPTVLWTGNGYHVYLPIQAVILDHYPEFSKDNFRNLFSLNCKYHNYSISEIFLKYAETLFANGKADPQHRPKYKTCLIRIPYTFNSKCLKRGLGPEESKAMIIQKWNGYRLPIQLMTREFRIWITQEEVNENLRNKKKIPVGLSHSVSPHLSNRIDWIEKLLNQPLEDNRKFCLRRILIPYLKNIKKLNEEEITLILLKWLHECNSYRKLDFSPCQKIKENLRNDKGFLPIGKDKLKKENPEIYNYIIK